MANAFPGSGHSADPIADTRLSDRDRLKTTVENLKAFLHGEFRGRAAEPRLHQLDSALATADMAIDHLYDEAERARYIAHPENPRRMIMSGDDPYRKTPEDNG